MTIREIAKICDRKIYIFLLPKYRYCYLNFTSTSAKEPSESNSLKVATFCQMEKTSPKSASVHALCKLIIGLIYYDFSAQRDITDGQQSWDVGLVGPSTLSKATR